MATTFKSKGGSSVEEVTKKSGGVEQTLKEEHVGHPTLVLDSNPLAEVEVGLSCTINTGNYENLKINVSLRMPCEATADEIDETFESVQGWVSQKLEVIHAELLPETK